ncbi:MAG: glycosyltransferase family 4 protein [Desulfobulbus sp.]|nr:glycosyltransferase family 4 protein [Desulfobulbus sp.]
MTVELANTLLKMGLHVRIAYFKGQKGLRRSIGKLSKKILTVCNSNVNYDWLNYFDGDLIAFNDLEEVSFSKDEVAIAVGCVFIHKLSSMQDIGYKAAYCHGLPGKDFDLLTSNWKYPLPTILVSENLRKPLLQLVHRPILGVVPNGIDHNLYYPREIERNGFGVLYSTSYEKAPEFTLELVNELIKSFPNKPIYIISREKKPCLPGNVRFFRYAAPALTAEIYNRCQIWLVPSRREGFGLPIIEAMACGTPVISTSTEGANFLIDNMNNGLLCRDATIKSFTDAIDKLLASSELYRHLTREGIATASKFNWNNCAELFLNVLGEEVDNVSR